MKTSHPENGLLPLRCKNKAAAVMDLKQSLPNLLFCLRHSDIIGMAQIRHELIAVDHCLYLFNPLRTGEMA
jgi:hypothetical protein